MAPWKLIKAIFNATANQNDVQLELAQRSAHAKKVSSNVDTSSLDLRALHDEEHGGLKGNGLHLKGADLNGASLDDADFISADLTGAKVQRASFKGAHLNHAKLGEIQASSAVFEGASFHNATAEKGIFESANFTRANLEFCNFTGANLTTAQFYSTGMALANFANADLRLSNMVGARIYKAHFEGAIIPVETFFKTINTTDAIFDENTKFSYGDKIITGIAFHNGQFVIGQNPKRISENIKTIEITKISKDILKGFDLPEDILKDMPELSDSGQSEIDFSEPDAPAPEA